MSRCRAFSFIFHVAHSMLCILLTDWQYSNSDSIFSEHYTTTSRHIVFIAVVLMWWYYSNGNFFRSSISTLTARNMMKFIYFCSHLHQHRNQNQSVENGVSPHSNHLQHDGKCFSTKALQFFFDRVSTQLLTSAAASVPFRSHFEIVDAPIVGRFMPKRVMSDISAIDRQLNENEKCGWVRDYQWWAHSNCCLPSNIEFEVCWI